VVSCPDIQARIVEDTQPARFEPVKDTDIRWDTHPHEPRKVQ
jgi:hypothetical protein